MLSKTSIETEDRNENHNLKEYFYLLTTYWLCEILSKCRTWLIFPPNGITLQDTNKTVLMWLHSKPKKQLQCVVLLLCHLWHWAFTQNLQLFCPHGATLLQSSGQAGRRPEFSFKFSHNLFGPQCCQQWHHLPLTTQVFQNKNSKDGHLAQASMFAAQRGGKNVFVGTVLMFLQWGLLKYLTDKVKMNELFTFKQWCIFCAILFRLICLPKNSYLVLIHNKGTLDNHILNYILQRILEIKVFSNKAELGWSFTLTYQLHSSRLAS